MSMLDKRRNRKMNIALGNLARSQALAGDDEIPEGQQDWSGDYAELPDGGWTGSSVYGNTGEGITLVVGSGQNEEFAQVRDYLPNAQEAANMLNQLIAVGGQLYRIARGADGAARPVATGQRITYAGAQSSPSWLKPALIAGALYLLFS